MKSPLCSTCGARMKKNGKTKDGAQRFRCKVCGSSFNQVKRCTTTRPKLLAGKEIYQLSKELLHIKTLKQAQWWTEQYLQWCEFWSEFLSEYTYVDGRKEYTHERLR